MNKEGSLRLSVAAVMFGLSTFMPNVWATSFIAFVGLYSLITGIVYLKRKDKIEE